MNDEPVEKQTDIDLFYRSWMWQPRGTVWQERPKCRSWFTHLDRLPPGYHNSTKKRPTGQVIRMKR